MPQLETPDRGQPLDISYLFRMVQEINRVSSLIGNSLSKIKYVGRATASQVLTSNLVFHAETIKLANANLSTTSNLAGSFNYDGIFKTTPIVISSVTSVSGVTNLYCVLSNITQGSCSVNVYSSSTSGSVDAEVSIIAIGEKISS